MKKAFTMIELIFVIVIIGILATIAIPRLSATRDDAKITAEIASLKTQIQNARSRYTVYGEKSGIESKTEGSVRAYFHTKCFWVQLAQYTSKKWYVSISPVDNYNGPGYKGVKLDINQCSTNANLRKKIYQKAKDLGLIEKTDGWTDREIKSEIVL